MNRRWETLSDAHRRQFPDPSALLRVTFAHNVLTRFTAESLKAVTGSSQSETWGFMAVWCAESNPNERFRMLRSTLELTASGWRVRTGANLGALDTLGVDETLRIISDRRKRIAETRAQRLNVTAPK